MVALSVANFWYWMVLPMPPVYDAGLSFDYFSQWVATLAGMSFVIGWAEERPFFAASLVALGEPIAFLPYALFGFAYRRTHPLQLSWGELLDLIIILALVFYFVMGFLLAILPALAGSVAKTRWRIYKEAKKTSYGSPDT